MRTVNSLNRKRLCVIALALAGAGTSAHAAVYSFEMAVPPDAEAVPMLKAGDGFGDRAAGDFPPSGAAGLATDGTARFVDSGSNGKDGCYILSLGSTFTVDMRVKANSAVQPGAGNDRRSMGIHDGSNGRGILVEPSGLTLVNGSGPVAGGAAAVDLSALHMVRVVVAGGQATIYDLEQDDDPGAGYSWRVLAGPVNLGGSGFPEEIIGAGGLNINSLDVSGGSSVQSSDFTLDFLRIDAGANHGATGGIISANLAACHSWTEPDTNGASQAFINQPASPSSFAYSLINNGQNSFTYTVKEVDTAGNATDYTWLGLSKTGDTVAAGASDVVNASIVDTSTAGFQTGYLMFGDDCGDRTLLTDSFAYSDGPLDGQDGWRKLTTAGEVTVASGVVQITGGTTATDAYHGVSTAGWPRIISVKAKIKAGTGDDSTLWNLWVEDANGIALARWYGGCVSARGRSGNNLTTKAILTGTGTWDNLEVRINTLADQAEFFFNGGSLGSLSYAGADNAVARVRFERLVNTGSVGHTIYFDDLSVAVAPEFIRRIDLNVIACEMLISPESVAVGPCGGGEPTTQVFTVSNTGAYTISSYEVQEIDAGGGLTDYPWLSLSYGGGAVDPGLSQEVIATIDWSQVTSNETAMLRLRYTCDGGTTWIRQSIRGITVRPGEPVFVSYNGNVAPDAADSGGPYISFTLHEGVGQGEAVQDLDATDSWAWHIQDVAGMKTKWRSTFPIPQNINGTFGATIVGRVKTIAKESPSGGNLFIFDDSGSSTEVMWGGPNGQVRETSRGEEEYVSGDADYHYIRVTVQDTGTAAGRVVRVYKDEQVDPVLEITNAEDDSSSVDAFGFGTGSTDGTQDVYFDCVNATNAGAFAPGEEEECLGRSLLCYSLCHTPFADVDGDLDVDQADFAVLQTCYTGNVGPIPTAPAYCVCLDRGDDDNNGTPDKDDDIDAFDVSAFEQCATGPDITWTPAGSGGCIP